MVSGRELWLPWDLLFGATYDHLCGGPHESFAWQLSLCMSTSEDDQWRDDGLLWLPNLICQIPEVEDQAWLYCLIWTRRELPKLWFWKHPYKVITQNTDVVYRIQCHPVVHLDRLAPYLEATQEEQPLKRQSSMSNGRWEQSMCSYLSNTTVSPLPFLYGSRS
jgi:hypothetical protein